MDTIDFAQKNKAMTISIKITRFVIGSCLVATLGMTPIFCKAETILKDQVLTGDVIVFGGEILHLAGLEAPEKNKPCPPEIKEKAGSLTCPEYSKKVLKELVWEETAEGVERFIPGMKCTKVEGKSCEGYSHAVCLYPDGDYTQDVGQYLLSVPSVVPTTNKTLVMGKIQDILPKALHKIGNLEISNVYLKITVSPKSEMGQG